MGSYRGRNAVGIRRKRTSYFPCNETTPLSRGVLKSKGHGKLSIHFTADYPTIETVFRIIISANQLSIYGAVANICEDFEAHQDRSGEPDVLMGQSNVLGEIKAEIPLQNENPSHHQILWQQYMERIESLSPESKGSGQGDGVPKAAADSRGSRTCVCETPFMHSGWHTQVRKDE